MSAEVSRQLTSNPRILYVAGIIGLWGLVPGMPNLVFLSTASFVSSYQRSQAPMEPDVEAAEFAITI